jgi:hypothetical protein
MTLGELVSSIGWHQVKVSLLSIRADVEPDQHEFEKVLGHLNALTPVASEMRLYIEKRLSGEEYGSRRYYVVGRDGTLDRHFDDVQHLEAHGFEVHCSKETVWSLWLTPWVEWLGMEIADETAQAFSPSEIAAYCLLEMTFYGYVENSAKEVSAELALGVAEVDAMTEAENVSWIIPLKEVVVQSRKLEE